MQGIHEVYPYTPLAERGRKGEIALISRAPGNTPDGLQGKEQVAFVLIFCGPGNTLEESIGVWLHIKFDFSRSTLRST